MSEPAPTEDQPFVFNYKGRTLSGSYNVLMGRLAGKNLRLGSRNFFLGEEAGADVTDDSDLILIGDGVRSPTGYPDGTVVIGIKPGASWVGTGPSRAYLGPVLFGQPIDWLKNIPVAQR